jgi:hypothetical protein
MFLVEETDHEHGISVSTLNNTTLRQCVSEELSLKKVKRVKCRKAESVFMEWFWQKQALHISVMFVRKYAVLFSRMC